MEERPRNQDEARRVAPLPACLVQLSGQRQGKPARTDGVVKSLGEDQLWSLVFPGYDAKRHVLPAEPRACNGRDVLADKSLEGGEAKPVIQEGDTSLGSGGDRLKIAWLRALRFPDGTEGGALALLRSYGGTAEVYAIGAFRGRPKTTFTLERVGPEALVVATDEGCNPRKAGAPCETPVTVFLPRFGVLERSARFAQERVAYAEGTESGIRGRVEYRLASATQFVDGGIRVQEQVMVRDDLGRELRKAELERSYTFGPDGSLLASEDSLWSRVLGPNPTPK